MNAVNFENTPLLYPPRIILFDFGGVLVDLDKERCIRAFAEIGFDIRPYLGTYKQAGAFELLERGTIGIDAFCKQLRSLCPALTASNEQIIRAWEAYLTGIPAERLEMLLKIRRHYGVSLLSNTNPIHWRQAEHDFFQYHERTITDFFDHLFLSFEMGLEKPAPQIFQRVASGLGVEPSKVLFLDDSEVNCRAARTCGFQSLVAPAESGWLKFFNDEGELQIL